MVSKLCWNCKFFEGDNTASLKTGICRRHAPRGIDYASFYLPNMRSMTIHVGRVTNTCVLEGNALLPLHNISDASLAPSCSINDAVGMESLTLLPLQIPEGMRPIRATVSANIANSGAATVGANPILKLVPVAIGGLTQTPGETISIPIPGANVQPHGSAGNLFFDIAYDFPNLNPMISGLVGFRLDLSGTTENDIAEVHNMQIGLMLQNSIASLSSTPVTSKAKFATIFDGSIQNCGEFEQMIGTIPAIP